jgi:glycosyltransferase involved in cell wall biosynthesis
LHIAFTQRHLDSGNGGEERSLFTILKYLVKEKDFELSLFYKKKGDLNEKLDSTIHQFETLTSELNKKNAFNFFLSVIRSALIVYKYKINRIHVNHYKDVTWAALVSIISGCRLSVHLRLNAPEYLSKQYAWGLKQCDFFIANSEFVKKDWSKYLDTNKIEVVYNGVDIQPDEIIPCSNDVDILFVGRIVYEKGLHLAIESLSRLENSRTLTVIGDFKHSEIRGDSDYKNYIEELIIKNKLENRVFFLGHIENPLPYVKKASLLVVPSYVDSFGRTFMEAWTLRTPAIASKCGGMLELLDKYPDLANFVFEEGDSHSLFDVIEQLGQINMTHKTISFDMKNVIVSLLKMFSL